MKTRHRLALTMTAFLLIASACATEGLKQEIISPDEKVIPLFNGKDFTGLYTWLKGQGRNSDPKGVFTFQDGSIHVSGDGMGYIGTQKAYRDYHLIVEYKWGTKVDGSGYVRNAGVLLHGTGPDGSTKDGIWMASLECQLAQGCEGDLIAIRGLGDNGDSISVDLASETTVAADGKTRWTKGGQKTPYSGHQFWWSKHEPFFEEKLDTRGKDDVASHLGEWTKVECICKGNRVTIKINGVTVNEGLDVWPAGGKILLQSEGSEIYYRGFELHPLK